MVGSNVPFAAVRVAGVGEDFPLTAGAEWGGVGAMTDGTVSDFEALRKEVLYRLSYRSTLELDNVCRAVLPHVDGMEETEMRALRDFLLLPENRLQDWLVDGKPAPEEVALQVAWVKWCFKHRLTAQ